MASRLEFFFGVIVFFAVFSALVFVLMPKEKTVKHAFEAVEDGVLFYSEEKNPRNFLLEFKDNNEFFVVLESSQNTNSGNAANAFITLQAVLTASNKKVISVIEEFSSNGILKSCQTNKGMIGVSDKITAKECIELLDSNSAIIIIKQADDGLRKPEVMLEKNKVVLKPKSDSNIQSMVFLLLKAMFADSEEKIKMINDYWVNVSVKS